MNMPVSLKYILFLLLVVMGFCRPLTGYAATGEKPILMICSYNPGAYPTSANVSDFMDEYERLGGKRGVVIENMNCKSFSDFPRWKGVMRDILDKYRGNQEPALIILFGQEAWASYLSLNDSVTGEVPVLCALTSRNVVLLPDDEKDLVHWMPESSDFYEDNLKRQVRGGFMYEYDIASNIRMIRAIYPDTKNIAFISDNTYGGVTLQAHVRREMKQFPELNLILLDGREHTIYTIVDELRKLPETYGCTNRHVEGGQERRLFYEECHVFDDGSDSGHTDIYSYFHRTGLLGCRRGSACFPDIW